MGSLLRSASTDEVEQICLRIVETLLANLMKRMETDVQRLKDSSVRKNCYQFLLSLASLDPGKSVLGPFVVDQALLLAPIFGLTGEVGALKASLTQLCPSLSSDPDAPIETDDEASLLKLMRQASGVALVSAAKQEVAARAKEEKHGELLQEAAALAKVTSPAADVVKNTSLGDIVAAKKKTDEVAALKKVPPSLQPRLMVVQAHLEKLGLAFLEMYVSELSVIIVSFSNGRTPEEQAALWDRILQKDWSLLDQLVHAEGQEKKDIVAKVRAPLCDLLKWQVLHGSDDKSELLGAARAQTLDGWLGLELQLKVVLPSDIHALYLKHVHEPLQSWSRQQHGAKLKTLLSALEALVSEPWSCASAVEAATALKAHLMDPKLDQGLVLLPSSLASLTEGVVQLHLSHEANQKSTKLFRTVATLVPVEEMAKLMELQAHIVSGLPEWQECIAACSPPDQPLPNQQEAINQFVQWLGKMLEGCFQQALQRSLENVQQARAKAETLIAKVQFHESEHICVRVCDRASVRASVRLQLRLRDCACERAIAIAIARLRVHAVAYKKQSQRKRT